MMKITAPVAVTVTPAGTIISGTAMVPMTVVSFWGRNPAMVTVTVASALAAPEVAVTVVSPLPTEVTVPLVFTVVTLGSVVEAVMDYALGRRLARIPRDRLSGDRRLLMERAQSIVDRFERHGAVYIAVNRFLPGIRALFFVAAGMARLPVGKVILWGALSAAAWNALIIAAGFAVGKNWDRLSELLRTYTMVAWIVVGVVMILLVVRWAWKKRS